MEVLGDEDEDPVLREEEQEAPALNKPAVMVDMGVICKVSTVDSVITHTPPWTPQGMGYCRVWVIKVRL